MEKTGPKWELFHKVSEDVKLPVGLPRRTAASCVREGPLWRSPQEAGSLGLWRAIPVCHPQGDKPANLPRFGAGL